MSTIKQAITQANAHSVRIKTDTPLGTFVVPAANVALHQEGNFPWSSYFEVSALVTAERLAANYACAWNVETERWEVEITMETTPRVERHLTEAQLIELLVSVRELGTFTNAHQRVFDQAYYAA